jgi:hypothetical protein
MPTALLLSERASERGAPVPVRTEHAAAVGSHAMKLYCEHEIALPAEEFWAMLHAPDYEARVGQAIGLRAYEELERRDEPDAIYRRLRVEADLPDALRGLVRRVAGDASAGYVEEQWRSRSRMEVRWRMQPNVLADRIRIEGVVRIEPRGARRCVRILDGVVEIGVFGLGGLLERAAIAMVIDAYAKGAEVAAGMNGS